MAQRALPPGAIRRRAVFGLFAADGWTWATIKATFWFLLIIFLLGYLPDRAYYFTVSPTVDVGYNVISPINWCSGANRGLPCPAPVGAVVPWERNPNELALPQPRTNVAAFSGAENIYIVGGETADGPTASVLASIVSEEGNLAAWSEGAALPEPRANGAMVVASGVPYYIGGTGADGNATTTVYRGILTEGGLSGWEEFEELALPAAVTDASAVATVRGIYLFGGRVDGQLSDQVWIAEFGGAASPELTGWTELTEMRLPEPRADASAVQVARFVYLLGGEGPDGITNSVFFLDLDDEGMPVVDEGTGLPQGWGVSTGQAATFALPEPRARHMSFVNAGAVYVIGGVGADGQLVETAYWASPRTEDGTIPLWRELEVTNLPEPRAGAGMAVVGARAFLLAGETADGPTDSVLRAITAPALPFFRLGLFGMTVPALSIQGEIGQQLGYIAAASVGTGMLILLIVIGVAYSHQRATLLLFERVSRGRFRAPPDEDAY